MRSDIKTVQPFSARRSKKRRGHSLVLLCLLFPVMLTIAAFCINIVYMEMARTELQIATDTAVRAAGRTLAVTGSQEQAIAAAERLLKANPYANQTMTLSGPISFLVYPHEFQRQSVIRFEMVQNRTPFKYAPTE